MNNTVFQDSDEVPEEINYTVFQDCEEVPQEINKQYCISGL